MTPSRTLPIVYVATGGGQPIVSKENYINAKIYIVDPTKQDSLILASPEAPAETEIRGRGNSSWVNFAKKPYKLKLGKKASPFGMPKSKHFVLIGHAPTQEYFHEAVSFELARLIGLGWVPHFQPVELVVNGEYKGVYAFGENIRIDDGRLEIAEQPDENTDTATIADGWLVEIDNTEDEPQILVRQSFDPDDTSAWRKRFTIKTPEALSDLQTEWITNEMTAITRAIHNPDKSSTAWADMIDVQSLARYYIIQELTCNEDAFVGSTYLYHDKGADKWVFGPIWDSGYTFTHDRRSLTFVDQRKAETGQEGYFAWIRELWEFPAFREAVIKEWEAFYPSKMEPINQFINDFYAQTKAAYAVNAERWPQYNAISFDRTYNSLRIQIPSYSSWLDTYLRSSTGIEDVEAEGRGELSVSVEGQSIIARDSRGASAAISLYDINGRRLPLLPSGDGVRSQSLPAGIYILRGADNRAVKVAVR